MGEQQQFKRKDIKEELKRDIPMSLPKQGRKEIERKIGSVPQKDSLGTPPPPPPPKVCETPIVKLCKTKVCGTPY